MNSTTQTLIGVADAAIAEAAERMEEMQEVIRKQHEAIDDARRKIAALHDSLAHPLALVDFVND